MLRRRRYGVIALIYIWALTTHSPILSLPLLCTATMAATEGAIFDSKFYQLTWDVPDRFELFLLAEGEKKITWKLDTRMYTPR